MSYVHIKEDLCKGCELCCVVCPKKIMRISEKINEKGYQPVEITDMDECTGCTACAIICPDCVLEIER